VVMVALVVKVILAGDFCCVWRELSCKARLP
jgi:hypothetical protein